MKKRERITWNDAEWALVLKTAESFGAPVNGDSERVWREVQAKCLPEHRHRPFDPSAMSTINKARRVGAATAVEARDPRKPSEAVTVMKAPPAATPPAPAQPPPAAIEPEPAPAPALSASESMVVAAHSILKEIALRFIFDPDVRAAAKDWIKEIVAPETQQDVNVGVLWRQPVAGQEKRRRVVIAAGGKFAAMQESVLRPVMRFYDLRFWNSREQHPARLRAILQGADAALIVTNSVSHGGAETVRAWGRNNNKLVVNYTKNVASLAEDLPSLLGDELNLKEKS